MLPAPPTLRLPGDRSGAGRRGAGDSSRWNSSLCLREPSTGLPSILLAASSVGTTGRVFPFLGTSVLDVTDLHRGSPGFRWHLWTVLTFVPRESPGCSPHPSVCLGSGPSGGDEAK